MLLSRINSYQSMLIKKFPIRYMIVTLKFISTCICYIEQVGFSIAYTAAANACGVSQSSKCTILSIFYMAMPVHKFQEVGQLKN